VVILFDENMEKSDAASDSVVTTVDAVGIDSGSLTEGPFDAK